MSFERVGRESFICVVVSGGGCGSDLWEGKEVASASVLVGFTALCGMM